MPFDSAEKTGRELAPALFALVGKGEPEKFRFPLEMQYIQAVSNRADHPMVLDDRLSKGSYCPPGHPGLLEVTLQHAFQVGTMAGLVC